MFAYMHVCLCAYLIACLLAGGNVINGANVIDGANACLLAGADVIDGALGQVIKVTLLENPYS